MGRDQYLKSDADEGINELALVDFAGWCSASLGNQAGATSCKLVIVQFFHVLAVGIKVPTQSPFVKRALPRARLVGCAVRCRGIRFSKGKTPYPHEESGGRVLWLCLGMSYCFHRPFRRGVCSGRGRGAPNPLFNTGRRSVLRSQLPVGLFKKAAGR